MKKIGWVFALTALLACLHGYPAAAQEKPPTGLQKDVIFAENSPLATSKELTNRLLSPLTVLLMNRFLERNHQRFAEHPIDPPQERYIVYVPAEEPSDGYGLFVFVPPWDELGIPSGWVNSFDRLGMIFVAPAQSGNPQSIWERRTPLALIAVENLKKRYRINSEKILVGGFSGGSRTAQHVLFAYPDLFRGSLQMAGSDMIGGARQPLPRREMLERLEQSAKIVMLTGDQDLENIEKDNESTLSLEENCFFDIDRRTEDHWDHRTPTGTNLYKALSALLRHSPPDPDKLAACRAKRDKDLNQQLAQAETLIAAGRREEAETLLMAIDHRFGSLAMPRIVELATGVLSDKWYEPLRF